MGGQAHLPAHPPPLRLERSRVGILRPRPCARLVWSGLVPARHVSSRLVPSRPVTSRHVASRAAGPVRSGLADPEIRRRYCVADNS